MKDLYELLAEEIGPRVQTTWWLGEDAVDRNQVLKPWVLLNRTEEMFGAVRKRVAGLNALGWTCRVSSCEIQFFHPGKLGDHLELEMRLHRLDRRTVEVRLSIWKVLKTGKTKRIGRAVYKVEGKLERKAA